MIEPFERKCEACKAEIIEWYRRDEASNESKYGQVARRIAHLMTIPVPIEGCICPEPNRI